MLEAPQVTRATTLVGANLAMLIAVLLVGAELAAAGITPLWSPLLVVPPLLVFGQLMPRAIVQAHADAIVDGFAAPLRFTSFVLRPIVAVVGGYAALLTKITRTDRKRAFVTRDELAMLLETDPETDKPKISADEREMIANVLELSEYKVGELMVPLSEVTALPEDAAIAEAALEVADKQHSRMPIYRSRVDDIVGIVHVFDLLQAASRGKPEGPEGSERPERKTVAGLAHPPIYVPQTMKASDLLVQLQTEQQHLAIVVDEYGGAVGICTIEDLLEIIVGDIDDEYDTEPAAIRVERPGVWRALARTSVARINTELDVGLPESEDYETIAGFLIEKLRHIPAKGEALTLPHVIIEVVEATDRAIESVRIVKRKK
jgi:CBS domain containing-hemolysin-like protein